LGISEAQLTTDSHPHFGLTVVHDGKPADISPTAEIRAKSGTAPAAKLEVETNAPGDYDIHPDVHAAGAYELVVTYKKSGGGTGQVTFPFTVEKGTGTGH